MCFCFQQTNFIQNGQLSKQREILFSYMRPTDWLYFVPIYQTNLQFDFGKCETFWSHEHVMCPMSMCGEYLCIKLNMINIYGARLEFWIFFFSFHVVFEYLVSFLIFSWITIFQPRILLSKTSEDTKYTHIYAYIIQIHFRYCIANYSAEKMFKWSSQKNENIEAKLSACFIWKI